MRQALLLDEACCKHRGAVTRTRGFSLASPSSVAIRFRCVLWPSSIKRPFSFLVMLGCHVRRTSVLPCVKKLGQEIKVRLRSLATGFFTTDSDTAGYRIPQKKPCHLAMEVTGLDQIRLRADPATLPRALQSAKCASAAIPKFLHAAAVACSTPGLQCGQSPGQGHSARAADC
jgi:hypothetical protein